MAFERRFGRGTRTGFTGRDPFAERDAAQRQQYQQQAADAKDAPFGSVARANDPNQYGSVASNQFPSEFGPEPARTMHSAPQGMQRRFEAPQPAAPQIAPPALETPEPPVAPRRRRARLLDTMDAGLLQRVLGIFGSGDNG